MCIKSPYFLQNAPGAVNLVIECKVPFYNVIYIYIYIYIIYDITLHDILYDNPIGLLNIVDLAHDLQRGACQLVINCMSHALLL